MLGIEVVDSTTGVVDVKAGGGGGVVEVGGIDVADSVDAIDVEVEVEVELVEVEDEVEVELELEELVETEVETAAELTAAPELATASVVMAKWHWATSRTVRKPGVSFPTERG